MPGTRAAHRRARLLLALVLGAAAGSAFALTCTSAATGNWSAPGTWTGCGGGVPAKADTAVIAAGHVVTVNATTTVGALTVNAGGTATLGGVTLTVAGATSVAGTLAYGNAAGAAVYAGQVTVQPGGAWSNPVGASVTFQGGLVHNGASFSSGPLAANGLTTFSVNDQAVSGASPVHFVRVSVLGSISVTNSSTAGLSITGTLDGTAVKSTFVNGANATLHYENATVPMATRGVLQASAAGNTVNYRGAAQAVATPGGGSYHHLTLEGSGAKALPGGLTVNGLLSIGGTASAVPAGGLTLGGDLAIGAGAAFVAGSYAHTLAGNFGNAGTFTAGTSTFTFNGTGAQALSGATTFYNLAMSNSAGALTLGATITVAGTLQLFTGRIVTGANRVDLGPAATVAAPNATGYVVGPLRKYYNAGASLGFFSGSDFPVGDATRYTPLDFVGGTTTTAGSLTVTVTPADHPLVSAPIPSTGIDADRSLNRYWTLANDGLTVGTPISALFVFVAGDIDPLATPSSFIAQRYDGAAWSPTTLVTARSLDIQVSGIAQLAAGANDFAVGEPLGAHVPGLGRFNAFESSTPAGAVYGSLYTKLAGVAFAVDVVTINAAGSGYGGARNNVTVELLDAGNNAGAMDANGCRPTWVVLQTFTTTLNIPSGGRVTLAGITVPRAYREARLRISSGTRIGCSTDNFAIRPQAFSVTSVGAGLAATNTGTGGAPVFRTGANFNLTATSLAGYDGIPALDNAKVTGSPAAGTIGGAFGAAPAATGTASGDGFFYSEVGHFGLQAYAVFDSAFTAVDQPADCTADFSNVPVAGKFGCRFGSTAIPYAPGASGFGRFIPDNFAVSLNAPQFQTACAPGGFGYVGQRFGFAIAPVITVTARSGTANGLSNATTTNYAGAYMKLSNAAGASLNQAPYASQSTRYARFDALGSGATPSLDTSGLPATTADPVIGTFSGGVGALTFSAGDGFAFLRSTTSPSAPFEADIALRLNVVDEDGVAAAGNPVSFGAPSAGAGMAFAAGRAFRFGRLALGSAHGSARLALDVPMEAQYWSGQVWRRNTLDGCTAPGVSAIAMGNYKGALNATNLPGSSLSVPGPLVAGLGRLSLARPTDGAAGSVDLAINLGASAGAPNCTALLGWSPAAPTVSGAGMDYLQDRWCRPGGRSDDPFARATFGVYRDKFIYRRENH